MPNTSENGDFRRSVIKCTETTHSRKTICTVSMDVNSNQNWRQTKCNAVSKWCKKSVMCHYFSILWFQYIFFLLPLPPPLGRTTVLFKFQNWNTLLKFGSFALQILWNGMCSSSILFYFCFVALLCLYSEMLCGFSK